MKRLSLILLTSLALGGAALAEDKPSSTSSPGSEMKKESDGKMSGPPNASGHEKAQTKDGSSDSSKPK